MEHIEMLVGLLESRLPYMRGRTTRIEAACGIIGTVLRLKPDEMYALSLAARFHDIGMLGIPDSLLLKTTGFSQDEMNQVNQHTVFGGRFTAKVFPDFPDLVEGIWYHHERPDGKGPHGLQGDEIPLVAGILALVEAIESMANDRPHRKAMRPQEIIAEVNRHAGTQFDTRVVNVFLTHSEKTIAVVRSEAPADAPSSPEPAREPAAPKQPAPPANSQPVSSRPQASVRPAQTRPAAPRKTIRAEDVTQIKALPTVVSAVLAIAGSQRSSSEDLCRTLAEDIALAGKVLGVANSSMYRGNGARVRSLDEAVRTIGFDAVREIALSVGVMDTLGKDGEAALDINAFWRHSFACACIATRLAAGCDDVDPTQVYVTALLHDMGKLIIAEFLPEELKNARLQAAELEPTFPSAERSALGTDHATLAAEVLKNWGIPLDLYAPIKNHHRANVTDDAHRRRLAETLQVADGLALALGWPSECLDYFPPLLNRQVKDLPALKTLDPGSLRSSVADEVRDAALLMGSSFCQSIQAAPEQSAQAGDAPIHYVTEDAEALDMYGLWLEYTKGVQLTRHRLSDETVRSPDMIVLSAGVPSPGKAKRVARLVEGGGSGIVVLSARWRKFLAGVGFGGYRVLETPLCVKAFEAAVESLVCQPESRPAEVC